MDLNAPKLIEYQLKNNLYDIDPRFNRALLEVVEQGKLPAPDVMFPTPVTVAMDKLALDFGGNTFAKDAQGNYLIKVQHPNGTESFDVKLAPKKKVMLHGTDGVVSVGIKSETMYYYSIPRCEATGTITINGVSIPVTGQGWFDHEFGGDRRENVYGPPTSDTMADDSPQKDDTHAWNWFAVQLSNGVDLSITNLMDTSAKKKDKTPVKKSDDDEAEFDIDDEITDAAWDELKASAAAKEKAKEESSNFDVGSVVEDFVVISDVDGKSEKIDDIVIKRSKPWISVRSSCKYFLEWNITCEQLDMDLHLSAVFPEQEVISMTAKPAFWEGRLNVVGTLRGEKVEGTGILERHNFSDMANLDNFFKRISGAASLEIRRVLPKFADDEQVLELMSDIDHRHLMEGADIKTFNKTIIHPLREIIDRGGKAWRSYALILCIDLVGGNSFKYKHWLAMPEIMHVGSLIIDDIQDKSDFRRDKMTCHKKHGEAIAINTGTAAYFLAIDALLRLTPDISIETRLRLYERYFLTLRAGHAGQAFDIRGLDHKVDRVCEGQLEAAKLEENIICTHRLKSAVPAGNLAYMGVLIGGGNATQANHIYTYFESLGVAFQIIDDVLNLKVDKNADGDYDYGKRSAIGKLPCEDIRCGKVTYPIVKALKSFSGNPAKQQELWDLLKLTDEQKDSASASTLSDAQLEKMTPEERTAYETKRDEEDKPVIERIAKIMEILRSVDARKESVDDATRMVEEAWLTVKDHIEDSFYKLMLRSFGFYVIQRHY